MQIPLVLDRSRPATLAIQIIEQLRSAIMQGRIAAGTRMPSSRQLADQLGVSRNTVVRAYDTLIVDGYVESRPASGMFAAVRLPEEKHERPSPMVFSPPIGDHAVAMPMPFARHRAQMLTHDGSNRLNIDFFPGRPSASLFPLKTWRRLVQRALSQGGAAGLTQYSDPAGLGVLRTAIAGHIAAARGIVADVNRIIVVSGIQEGINIAARLFLSRGTIAVVENPGYQGARFAFEAAGGQVLGVAVDRDGLVIDALPHAPAALIHVTPSHQYPTGPMLPLVRRQALISWARRTGCYILEDDYDGDFRYEGSPLPSIASLAPDCTIYLGTFSKSLGAGLRLGYMVVPEPLAEAARTEKALLNNGNPWLDQAALAEMIRSRSYTSHLTRLRTRYKESRDSLLAALRREFGDVEVSGEQSGLHVFWALPAGVPDASILEAVARRARLGVYAIPSAGAYDTHGDSTAARRGIVLGYASLLPRQIEQGVSRLSQAIDDALELPPSAASMQRAPAAKQAPGSVARPSWLDRQFAQQPALRAGGMGRANSGVSSSAQIGLPMPTVTSIYRYPIKGLSPQRVSSAVLQAGQPFPQDRIFALARPSIPYDVSAAKWSKKGSFVMLMLEEVLARVRTHLDVETFDFTVNEGNHQVLAANLCNEQGRADVEEFYRTLVPTLKGAPRLVRAQGGHFMDKPDNVLSMINLATVRSLEAQWGFEIDPLRFRANFYIDGAEPWEEFDWIGRDIVLGDALFRVDRRNGRCGATNVDPASGRRDLDIPGSLRAAFGHKDLGVYLVTRKSGAVAIGAEVRAPRSEAALMMAVPPLVSPINGHRRFICRGCYYIYEEASGVPAAGVTPGTKFGEIPDVWKCPDCGTEKGNYRPYVEKNSGLAG